MHAPFFFPQDDEFAMFVRSHQWEDLIHVVVGTPFAPGDLVVRCFAADAVGIIVLVNQHSLESEKEDAEATMLAHAIRLPPELATMPVFVQVYKLETKQYIQEAHQGIVAISQQDIKISLLARSATSLGVSTLMFNLSCSSDHDNAATAAERMATFAPWKAEYMRGATQEFYNIKLDSWPETARVPFLEAALQIYTAFQVLLIGVAVRGFEGVIMIPRDCILTHRDSVIVVAEDDAHAGMVREWLWDQYAAGQVRVSDCTRAAFAALELLTNDPQAPRTEATEKVNQWQREVPVFIKKLESCCNEGASSHQCKQATEAFLDKIAKHEATASSSSLAPRNAGTDVWHPNDPAIETCEHRVVVIGPSHLEHMDFFRELHDWRNGHDDSVMVTVLEKNASHLEGLRMRLSEADVPLYSEENRGLRLVQGDPLSLHGLLAAGAEHATSILILQDDQGNPKDKRHLADAYEIMVHNRIATFLRSRNLPRPSMIVELLHGENLVYLDTNLDDNNTPAGGEELGGAREHPQETALFAAGCIYNSEILDRLVCQTLYNPIVGQMTDILMSHQVQHDTVGGGEDANDFNISFKQLVSVPVPRVLVGLRYSELFAALVEEKCICLGLYRAAGSLMSPLGHVATNPKPDSVICKGDSMFILRLDWRPAEAVGRWPGDTPDGMHHMQTWMAMQQPGSQLQQASSSDTPWYARGGGVQMQMGSPVVMAGPPV